MKCDQIWSFFPHCTWVAHFSSQWLSFLWIFDPRWGISNSTTSNAGANRQFCGPALFFKHFRNIFEILSEIFLIIWCPQSNAHKICCHLICYTWCWNVKLHGWKLFFLTLNRFQMHFRYEAHDHNYCQPWNTYIKWLGICPTGNFFLISVDGFTYLCWFSRNSVMLLEKKLVCLLNLDGRHSRVRVVTSAVTQKGRE